MYWNIQYIPRNMRTVFALLCFVVVIHWLIFPYPPGLLHWHCGNLTIAPVPAKQPWWIWINTSCEFIVTDCITTTKQSTTKQCAYFLGYIVFTFRQHWLQPNHSNTNISETCTVFIGDTAAVTFLNTVLLSREEQYFNQHSNWVFVLQHPLYLYITFNGSGWKW